MRKLRVFNSISLDGYFTDQRGDMSWAHKHDPEWEDFSVRNSTVTGEVTFLFGRVTYELMASFWPTPEAHQQAPEVAAAMNARHKLVFSRTLKEASWSNTTLLKGDPVAEVKRLKQEWSTDLMIFGSGSIVAPLAAAGLIDEYRLVINPLVLGAGRSLFQGVGRQLPMKRLTVRDFANGNLVVSYEPVD